jgi:hypothetical protein
MTHHCPRCAGKTYLDEAERPPDIVCLMCGYREPAMGRFAPLPLTAERNKPAFGTRTDRARVALRRARPA